MLKKLLNSRTKTTTFAAFLLAASSFLSQFLGLLRDRLLAGHFGAGSELDMYFAAFKIPDLVYGILIVGGITGAFLPVLAGYFKEKKGEADNAWPKEAMVFVNTVLNCFLILIVVVCLILAAFAPLLVKFIIPGFSPENKEITVALTRIMFLSPVLFGLSSIFSGVVQYFDKFFVYALAPILYNVGIIIGILFFVPIFGIYGLAYGVIFGAAMYLIVQIPPAWHSGFEYKPVLDFHSPGLKKIFTLMIPRTFSSAVYYINLIFITALASTLATGSVSIFTFSDNIQSFPTGIIGLSFAISAFPVFSKIWASGKKEEFIKSISASLRQVIFLIIPASVLMFLLRIQIIRIILGTGKFGWWETRLTAAVLGIFCFSIFANSLIPLLTRIFFSFHNTKTPMIISVGSIIVNVAFSFLFLFLLGFQNAFQSFFIFALRLEGISDIGILALPLSLSFAALFQVILLTVFLYRKIGDFRIPEIWESFLKSALAAAIMGILVYVVRQYTAGFVNMQTFWGIFLQTALAGTVGIAVYWLATTALKCPETKDITTSLLKQFNR